MPFDNAQSASIDLPQRRLLSEFYAWTLRSDATASCFAEDVFRAQESGLKEFDFYWLGRVPCRTVKLVGTVVGIKDYEIRRVYTIDDGTAEVECAHRPSPPSTPSKTGSTRTTFKTPSPPLPPPICTIGRPVTIIGHIVKRKRPVRQITVVQITSCSSVNDEAVHWKLALDLHRDYYFIETPFSVPQHTEVAPKHQENTVCKDDSNDTSKMLLRDEEHHGPESNVKILSSPAKSPSKPVSTSTIVQSPPKLRHPTRLHTRELTTNTFRIYVKHYMDNHSVLANDDDLLDLELCNIPDTPTKRHRVSDILTPKMMSNCAVAAADRTLCIKRIGMDVKRIEEGIYGFTLSYLRRVPELRDMARKVVDAEDRRKRREERKAREEGSSKGSQKMQKTKMKESGKKLGHYERRKRLFRQAILKLCDEGSIVIWDGPKRDWKPEADGDARLLWKMDTTTSSSWIGNTPSGPCEVIEDEELSDPAPDEESYVPLTAGYLGKYVEKAIKEITDKSVAPECDLTSGPKGPNKKEILMWLRGDGRWRRVGDWAVEEALNLLKEEERIWEVGEGRWELTI